MASTSSKDAGKRSGGQQLRTARSFSRNETPLPEPRPQRASTFQNGASHPSPKARRSSKGQKSPLPEAPDAFETSSTAGDDPPEPPRASVDMEDLPIELISLTDSFIDSLSAKVHPMPPNIDNLSRMFQEFYAAASAHINTHISSLITRQTREQSPAPSPPARPSPASLLRSKAASIGSSSKDKNKGSSPRSEPQQQMITAEELADRKRARKALEQKRSLLEEAAERRLCEGIYDRIYRHRSTQDEAQDDKLRSKTAALAVVGIGPSDLGVDLGDTSHTPEGMAARQGEVRQWLNQARRDIELMSESRYPLGKLNRLKSAHKSIVETLAHFHPSSSADEIMPMLIYTLITLPPEKLSVISDLNFIQRFRWEPKVVGEAAYCLTNLEAAISFLDTVDLSTLRPDEHPSGPAKPASRPGSPKTETFPPAYSSSTGVSAPALGLSSGAGDTTAGAGGSGGLKPAPSSTVPSGLRAAVQLRNRRLSDLVNTPAQAFGAAGDAVFGAADQGLKNITNSLGDSYKFLLGKLRERESSADCGAAGDGPPLLVVPKTLDEARKLIGTPPLLDDDGGSTVSASSSIHSPEETMDGGGGGGRRVLSREEKMLNLISGRKNASRDHSADSNRSVSSSSRKVLFAAEEKTAAAAAGGGGGGSGAGASPPIATGTGAVTSPSASTSSPNPALIDSVRSFSNSLNPISRLSGIGMMRGFGRNANTPTPTPPAAAVAAPSTTTPAKAAEGGDLASAFPDIATALPPKQVPQIAPPIKKFMETQTAAQLQLGDIGDLLRDYRRLAAALRDRDAFKEVL